MNPTHYTQAVLESLEGGLPVPVVWNTGGYERKETIQSLEGKVQVYLPDLKYALPGPAKKYSVAEDYFEWASAAIREMFRQTGPYQLENGQLKRGVLIRHLLLPGELENTRRVIDWVAETFRPGDVMLSLMSQYTPTENCKQFPEINRRVTTYEYRKVADRAAELGFFGFAQDRRSAKEEYTPPFNLEGV